MSIYKIGEPHETGFVLVRKEGQVEMWHNPQTGSYVVILYEHANWEEYPLLTKTLYSKDKADAVFDTVLGVLKD